MRLVFAGTPEAAVPSLRRLAGSGHELAAVVTRPDAPRGRKRVMTPSPVAVEAEGRGIPVIRAARLRDESADAVEATEPDLGVVVAYGGLIREPLLSAPRHGWINLHFSSLPRWRGAAPVQRALMAGETTLGYAVFRLEAGLDTGPVFAQRSWDAPDMTTASEALGHLAERGADLLSDVVDAIADGSAHATPQRGAPTTAAKLTGADGGLDWADSADAVIARWRGVSDEPGAHTSVGGARLKIVRLRRAAASAPTVPSGVFTRDGRDVLVGTGTVPVVLDRVQPAGKAAMSAADWWRGLHAQHLEADR